MSEHIAWVLIPGQRAGDRIGIVKLDESGYYRTDYDRASMSEADAQATVDHMNSKLGVPKEIAKSARDGSMFGWHTPAAQHAVEWFRDQAEAANEYWRGKRLESYEKRLSLEDALMDWYDVWLPDAIEALKRDNCPATVYVAMHKPGAQEDAARAYSAAISHGLNR